MLKYIVKVITQFIFVLFVVSILIFVLIRLSPTDPVAVILGGHNTNAELIANTRAKYGLDKSLIAQYFTWIGGFFTGDLGIGFKNQQDVGSLIASRLPITCGLVLIGTIISLIVAIPLGVLAGARKNSMFDNVVSILSLVLVSVPPFVTAMIMIVILARVAPSFPITGGYSDVTTYLSRIIFPCIALALPRITLLLRVTRSGMTKQMDSNYVQAAIAKGLPERIVIFKHALRNAIIPVLSIIGIQVGGLIVNAVLVENIFSLSGIGTLLIDSINSSDYPIVEDITLMLVFVFLLSSTVVDVLYGIIDPRVRNATREMR